MADEKASSGPLHPWRQASTLDDMFLYHLARLMGSAGSMVVRLCEGGFGITRREWRMVGLLADIGPMRPSELAEQAQLDRTRTSRAISALVAKGLVSKHSLAGDARQALLQLTPSGWALHAELFPQVQAINQELLRDVTQQELEVVSRTFARIRERAADMQQQGNIPKAPRNRNQQRAPEKTTGKP